MEAMLSQVGPIQLFFMFAIQLWVVVIFPVMVLRKLNYLTQLVESQFDENPEDGGEQS